MNATERAEVGAIFKALSHERRDLPGLLFDPVERLKAHRRIAALTAELVRRYPPDLSL